MHLRLCYSKYLLQLTWSCLDLQFTCNSFVHCLSQRSWTQSPTPSPCTSWRRSTCAILNSWTAQLTIMVREQLKDCMTMWKFRHNSPGWTPSMTSPTAVAAFHGVNAIMVFLETTRFGHLLAHRLSTPLISANSNRAGLYVGLNSRLRWQERQVRLLIGGHRPSAVGSSPSCCSLKNNYVIIGT